VVIFVTAYDRHAVQAFEVNAMDYLLKPFDAPRFRGALERARQRIRERGSAETAARLAAVLGELTARARYARRVAVETAGGVRLLDAGEIDWVEADGNYLRLHAGAQTHLVRQTLREMEERLDPREFLRIHRSAMVRIDRIREITPWFRGTYDVVLASGARLRSGRAFRDRLRALQQGLR
jgi:two-component system LytT family response regulator